MDMIAWCVSHTYSFSNILTLIQIVSLEASTNNEPSTVLQGFVNAVRRYGLPLRLRGDRGGENVLVCVYMILTRGPNRASFMWGS